MRQHYRHHRVVARLKEPEMQSFCDSICDSFTKQPILCLVLILLFILMLFKCLICHK